MPASIAVGPPDTRPSMSCCSTYRLLNGLNLPGLLGSLVRYRDWCARVALRLDAARWAGVLGFQGMRDSFLDSDCVSTAHLDYLWIICHILGKVESLARI